MLRIRQISEEVHPERGDGEDDKPEHSGDESHSDNEAHCDDEAHSVDESHIDGESSTGDEDGGFMADLVEFDLARDKLSEQYKELLKLDSMLSFISRAFPS
jgi:hypothetical protein